MRNRIEKSEFCNPKLGDRHYMGIIGRPKKVRVSPPADYFDLKQFERVFHRAGQKANAHPFFQRRFEYNCDFL